MEIVAEYEACPKGTRARIATLEAELAGYKESHEQYCPSAARIAQLEAALADAIECVGSWAAYASPYFQEKHDLAGDIARLQAALAGEKRE
jgi:hypothetical protein